MTLTVPDEVAEEVVGLLEAVVEICDMDRLQHETDLIP